MELIVDPTRKHFDIVGIPIRAKFDGNWGTYDINHLDRASLMIWLRSRGGQNDWAENTVAILLGHEWEEENNTMPEATDNFTDDFITNEVAETICKVGQGANCCRYLTMSSQGWSCEKKTSLRRLLDQRVEIGAINARADNCGGRRPRP